MLNAKKISFESCVLREGSHGTRSGSALLNSLAPESNFWLRDCHYLRYRKFRWAIKAQLNLLPVASHRRKYDGLVADSQCRSCTGNVETQKHCLSVYHANILAMKLCHDKIMEHLVDTIPNSLGTKFLDQTAPGYLGLQR